MSRIQPEAMTNRELARAVYATGVKNLTREELERVADRYVELVEADTKYARRIQDHVDKAHS